MFTGIITEQGAIKSIAERQGGLRMIISVPQHWNLNEGESISVNGICSTVCKLERGAAQFNYMPETIAKTTVSSWKRKETVNLERSLRLGDRLNGHLLLGHIEGVGEIIAMAREQTGCLFRIAAPRELTAHITTKGSIALDGVSLTAVEAKRGWFSVALTPYTLQHTNWKNHSVGSQLNIETDILGRQRAAQVLAAHAKNTQRKK